MLSKRQLFFQNLAQTSDSPLAIEIDHAHGIYLFKPNGEKIIDLISGISVSSVGHTHPKIIQAIQQQSEKYLHLLVYGEIIQTPQVQLAELITKNLPGTLNNVFFVNSGSEAVEGAMKLSKRYTRRTEIIAFKNAYHGATQGSLSIAGDEDFKTAFRPLLPDIKILEFNNLNVIQEISSRTACVFIEPVQGEAGVRVATIEFIQALRKRCTETGTLLVFDEIQTGLGRTGLLFAFQHYNIVPDILLLAKALGGGMPLGAFIASEKIMSVLKTNPVLGHITTFGGHPLSCAAAKASFEITLNFSMDEIIRKGNLFNQLLVHKAIKEIRGKGLLIAVELDNFETVKKVINLSLKKGLLTDWFLFCSNSLRIAPPLIITDEQINEACQILLKVLDEVVH